LIGKNLPPETSIVHWSFIELAKPEGDKTCALLCLTTTAYHSEGVKVFIYDGPNGSKEIAREVPPQIMGRVVGETMTDLFRSGIWAKRSRDEDDGLLDL